ncbi:hypothetical protein CN210_31075 [Sinorhizobium meliloti]|nr:hypothetical protein CN210_31075 [Sinorhizobium meliloti]
MPVSLQQVGSLSATNIVTLCANHHREVHYGDVSVSIGETEFSFLITGNSLVIPRPKIAKSAGENAEWGAQQEKEAGTEMV